MKRTKDTKRKNSGRLTAFLLAVCIILICALCVYIAGYYKLKTKTEKENSALSELYKNSVPKTEEIAQSTPAEQSGNETEPLILTYPRAPETILPAFEELLKINPDTVGFLHIPALTVDDIELCVVKRDNSFYLSHDFYGNESKAGCVFMDAANEIWPQDEHLILYGHNMKNGTMLARITRYKSLEYARNNPILYFDTLYEKGTYVVLAALQLPAENMLTDDFNIRTFTFGEVRIDAFMRAVKERAYYVTSAGADENDQLLSVITCSYNENDERFVLMCRRLRENETENDIFELTGRK